MSTRYSDTSDQTLHIDPDEAPRSVGSATEGVRLWAALAVAAVAVAGFGGVVAYGYLAYADRGGLAPAPLVQADARPAKVKPENPGGMTVPHQDKGIFAVGGRDGSAPARPGVENLLPLPEAPLPKPSPALVPVQQVAAAPSTAVTPADPAASRAAASRELEPLVSTGKVPFPAPLPPPAAPPVRTASLQPPAALPGTAAAERAAGALPAAGGATARPSARFRIQVGAMRTEAEAREGWEKVKRKHGDVLGGLAANYSRIEVPGKGEFVRIQAGPLPDAAAARDACARLAKGGTGCLVVPPS